MRIGEPVVVVSGLQNGFQKQRTFRGPTAPGDAVAWIRGKERATIKVVFA
jgi:hypothetical protein